MDDIISVPPMIMGGYAGGDDILSRPNYATPYLGLVSVSLNAQGSRLKTDVMEAASQELGVRMVTFIQGLSFDPAIRAKTAVPSRFLILFVTQGFPSFDDPATWPWDEPWVIEALKTSEYKGALPVVAELAFHFQDGSSGSEPGLEYASTGSDWCGMLFKWIADPISHRQVRKWEPWAGLEGK